MRNDTTKLPKLNANNFLSLIPYKFNESKGKAKKMRYANIWGETAKN